MLHILASKTDFDKLIGFNKKNYLNKTKFLEFSKILNSITTKDYIYIYIYIYIYMYW